VGPELSVSKTVITAAKLTIAMAAIATLVATDMQGFPPAAIAVCLAPVAADAPVKRAAWTAIV
jgi:hypothetical protein